MGAAESVVGMGRMSRCGKHVSTDANSAYPQMGVGNWVNQGRLLDFLCPFPSIPLLTGLKTSEASWSRVNWCLEPQEITARRLPKLRA